MSSEVENIESEGLALLKTGEIDVLAAAKEGWAVVESAISGLVPELQADLAALLKGLESSLEGGKTIDETVTALLNLAESSGKTFVLDLGTDVLNGLVAALLARL